MFLLSLSTYAVNVKYVMCNPLILIVKFNTIPNDTNLISIKTYGWSAKFVIYIRVIFKTIEVK